MKRAFVSTILQRVAPSIGATVEVEPEYGFVGIVTFGSGRRIIFKDRNFNVNPQGSSEIARDKGYTSYFLRHFGYSVPPDLTVYSPKMNERLERPRSIDDGYAFAQAVGWPVMVKPNNLSQGALISKVHNKREFYSAAKAILKKCSIMVVQAFVTGSDYRIVVLDNEVISAYERSPLEVVGDGKSSVRELLYQKQAAFVEAGRDTELDPSDPRIIRKLRKSRLSLDSVVDPHARIALLDVANLSTGGEARDVTDTIHHDFKDLAIQITKDFQLRLCGVDIITTAIDQPAKDYWVIELNSAPGLDNYASLGSEQQSRVDELYRKVLLALA